METKPKNISLKAILIIIAAGIWISVFQNAGIIPTEQRVKVTNTVDTYSTVTGEVEIENTVDVNIVDLPTKLTSLCRFKLTTLRRSH